MRPQWCEDDGPQGIPDGSKLHSILNMRIFVNGEEVRNLDMRLSVSDEVQILQALSGR
jgi:hypothetical protein